MSVIPDQITISIICIYNPHGHTTAALTRRLSSNHSHPYSSQSSVDFSLCTPPAPDLQPDYEDTSYAGVPVHMQIQPANGAGNQASRKISASSGVYDDPYYCGLKARVPNFGQRDPLNMSRRERERLQKDAIYAYASSNHSSSYLHSLYGATRNRDNGIYRT